MSLRARLQSVSRNKTKLYLYNNQLSGEIPADLLPSLANLRQLFLSNNNISGMIPPELSLLTNLQGLYLNNNQISGEIPQELALLSNLQILYLHNNELSGTIPSALSCITTLQGLRLNNNELSGIIPSEMSSLTNLRQLYLNDNQLSGMIPPELSSLTNLEYLSLYSNQFSGIIPSELSCLTKLRCIFLQNNQLSGTIPTELKNIFANCDVNLSNNYFNFSEDIPAKWKTDNAFQELPNDRKISAGLLPEYLGELGFPKKVIRFLVGQQLSLPNDESKILRGFETGEYPLGFHDSLLWEQTLRAIQDIPNKMKELNTLLKQLENEELVIQERLAKIEEAQQVLTGKLESTRKKQKEIVQKLFPYEEILSYNYEEIAQHYFAAEHVATEIMKKQFENPEEFRIVDEKSPKLSFIFNAFGMSKASIAKLSDINGYEFMDSEIGFLCEELNINSFGERKQLAYIQNMVKDGTFYGGKHQERCPVCNTEKANDFVSLVGEHAQHNEFMNDLDLGVFLKNDINGRAFLALTTQDVKKHLSIPDGKQRSFFKTKRYFEKIHRECSV